MRLGIAHHLGWAVAVTASPDYEVVDRRRIELIEPGVAAAPIHHEGKPLDLARARGWDVHFYDAKDVEVRAAAKLGKRADEIMLGPRATLGPPWGHDQRMALAAAIMAD